MCGIAGIYAPDGTASAEAVLAMAGDLRHRGPDGAGVLLDGPLAVASCRLAVVDLLGGNQPIPNEDGRFWALQNGEIYNYVELRDELLALGHSFSTACDTEVLAHGWEEWDAGLLERLNGDFAVAIWDRARRELILARDRFGVRPLFVARAAGAFLFASEAKALLRHPAVERALDPVGVLDAFTLWSTLPDRSALAGISELPPAHLVRLRPDGAGEPTRWWRLPLGERAAHAASPDELAGELLELLLDATRLRLRADVDVGVYVSGGLDSTLLATLARDTGARPHGFGLTFADELFDESGHQVAAAAALGLPLTRVSVGAGEIAAAFPRTVALAERPTLRTAPTPLLLLSAAVRAHGLKVVLTGEGADELLGGYEIFQEAKVRRFWSRDPGSRLRPLLLRRLYPYLARDLASTGEFLARAFGRGLDRPDDPLFSHLVRLSNGERLHGLFDEGFLERARADGGPAERLRRTLPPDFDGLTPLARAQLIEITTFLQGYLLHVQGDRMLMGNSVEGRFPYLDHRVAELAARVPDTLLLRGLDEKELLRRAARKCVPHGLAERRKRPYRAPIAAALAGQSSPEWLVDLLQPRRLAETAVFAPEAVGRLLRKSRSGALLSELEEMALAGVVSTLLLHEQLVANPERREAVVPDRVVVDGAVVGEGGAVAAASGGA